MIRAHARVPGVVALAALAALGCGVSTVSTDETPPTRVAAVQSAVVGAATSSTDEDFTLFLTHLSQSSTFLCAATLVAPNLAVTAKHCVYRYDVGEGECGPDGNPAPGDPGGYVTGTIPSNDIAFFKGVDGRKRFVDQGASPDALAQKIVDDGTIKLCSYDLAYVVLDRPITGVPVAKMRLGTRPVAGAKVAVAGWGQVEDRIFAKIRQSRADIPIRGVGDATTTAGSTSIFRPRTFQSGPGACKGDSGGPGFDPTTGTLLGVITRGLGFDEADPVSPCRPDTVSIVYSMPIDFPDVLRAAFTEAKAEPWLEGKSGAGFLHFDDACTADLECQTAKCASIGAQAKRCNLDCTKTACPATHECGGEGMCVPLGTGPKSTTSSSGASSGSSGASSGNPAGDEPPPPPDSRLSDCSFGASHAGRRSPLMMAFFAALFLLRRRRGDRASP